MADRPDPTEGVVRVRRSPGGDDRVLAAVHGVAERLGAEVRVTSSHVGAGGAPPPTWTIGDVTLPERPEAWRIEAAVLRSLAPRHLLFLCVANSARSQLAEGVARALAAGRVRVSSAGSVPTEVRPEARAVLTEIGIDASAQRSKGVEEVDRPVDAVITLCAEEACPLWLESAWRLHWPLPDPASSVGEGALDAFRSVRDTLVERLGVLLGPAAGARPSRDG